MRWVCCLTALFVGFPVVGEVTAQQQELGLRASRGGLPHDHDFPLNIAPVREYGQPVIPVFEGWFPNPDGTVTLTFEYFNLNSQEAVDVPLGPDNFIEPREYDGVQPTHFHPAPLCCNRRHLSSFIVTIPGDYTGDVVWTLRSQGQTYSVPGRAVHEAYRMDDLEAFTISPVAPELRFDSDPDGATGRGRRGVTHGPVDATVGVPLPISVWVDPQPPEATRVVGTYAGAQMEPRTASILVWYHHQGPGEVIFGETESMLEGGAGEVRNTATFSEPGEYLLRVWAIENYRAVDQHCCWSNGYIRVNVDP